MEAERAHTQGRAWGAVDTYSLYHIEGPAPTIILSRAVIKEFNVSKSNARPVRGVGN